MPHDIRHLIHAREPNWRPRYQYPRDAIPALTRGWLLDPGSLTRRLQCACRGRFSVRVLAQGRGRPHWGEMRALGLRDRGRAVIREVLLCCDGEPWVYARSVIPATTLRGRERRLDHLGNRSLGPWLFAQPSLRRTLFELVRIRPGDGGYRAATGSDSGPPIWGRRSVFSVHGRPLLVSEVFLPTLPAGGGPGRFRLQFARNRRRLTDRPAPVQR